MVGMILSPREALIHSLLYRLPCKDPTPEGPALVTPWKGILCLGPRGAKDWRCPKLRWLK
jgi:hypothetical protein